MSHIEIDRGKLTLPFSDFIDKLKSYGFVIGVDHYLRLNKVIRQFGPHTPPDELKYVLCPLFAVNQKQQELFYRLFDQYFDLNVLSIREQSKQSSWEKEQDATEKMKQSLGSRPFLWVLFTILIALAFTGWLWNYLPSGEPDMEPPLEKVPPVTEIGTSPNPIQPHLTIKIPQIPDVTFYQRYYRHIQIVGVFIPMLLFFMSEWYRRKQRQLALKKNRADLRWKTPPLFWQIEVPSPPPSCIKNKHFFSAAATMRKRMESDIRCLDIEKSVTETIKHTGFPISRYKFVTKPSEYLILIDLAHTENHYSRYLETLTDTLTAEGIFIKRYFYKDDPQVCLSQPGEKWVALSDVMDRHRHCRLIIIGDGESMIDPINGGVQPWTDIFQTWQERAVLTPKPPKTWGGTEISLARDFIVLPATLDGINAIVEHFEAPARLNLKKWVKNDKQPDVPDSDGLKNFERLKSYLGDDNTFQWLCACAVYPHLHWNLTLHLGVTLFDHTRIEEEKLLRLIRLPWFHDGKIPEEHRLALIDELDPEKLQQVRESIFQLIEQNPPPEKSAAYDAYCLNLAAYRTAVTRKERKYRRKYIKKILKELPETGLIMDYTIIRFLKSKAASPLALLLPKKLHKMFFRGGWPFFGIKTSVRATGYALIAAIFLLLPKPDVVEIAENETRVSETHIVKFLSGDHGTIIGATEQSVTDNSSCTPVEAVPDNNYEFISWEGIGFAATDINPLTVKDVTGDLTITANFRPASDTTPPMNPEFLSSEVLEGKITLVWESVSARDIDHYNVYYGLNEREYNPAVSVGNVTRYTFDSLNDNVTYYFAVTAVDKSGNESAWSRKVTAKIPLKNPAPDTAPPMNPPQLFLNVLDGKINLTWEAVAAGDIDYYNVYYGLKEREYNPAVSVGNVTRYTFKSLKEGIPYYFAVSAVDKSGIEGALSSEETATIPFKSRPSDTTPPLAPELTPANVPEGKLTLSWDAVPGSDIDHYNVYYGLNEGEYNPPVPVGNVTRYTIGSLVKGKRYYFAVSAVNTAGLESELSGVVSAIIPLDDFTPPSLPELLSVNVSGGKLVLVWEAVSDNDIDHYNVYYGLNVRTYNSQVSVGNVTRYTFDSLKKGTTYYFAVTAVDQAGNESGYSNVKSGVIPELKIQILSPTTGGVYSTTTDRVDISGTIPENINVSIITWNNLLTGESGTADGTTSWTISNIALGEGENVVQVTIKDSSGNSANETITIIYSPNNLKAPENFELVPGDGF